MKAAPIRRLASKGRATAVRFPEVLVCAAVAVVGGVVGVNEEGNDATVWVKLWMAGSLGLPLFAALALASERHGWATLTRGLATVGGMAVLAVVFVAFGRWGEASWGQRYIHLSATLHMAVAVVPYVRAKEPWGFWHYNRSLLFRFAMAGVYAAATFAGLALALAAIDNLLGVDVPDITYPRVFFVAAFGLHPLIFLAGVPRDFHALEAVREYPAWLRVFSQHVMLPLVALYVAILMVYMGKILLTGTWPSGWISYLVSGLAVAGIFSLLMVHPERMRTEHSWIDHYALAFWIAVLPSAGMVGMALWQRFQQYGVTERRYLLGLLAVWLAGAAVHRVVTRTRDIKSIPLALAVLGALSFVGPWSAYAVAERSQTARIERILSARGVLDEGALAASAQEIPFDEWRQVEDAVAYLVDNHGTDIIDAWSGGVREAAGILADEDGEPAGQAAGNARVARVMERLGVLPGPSGRPVEIRAASPAMPVSAGGYDLLLAHWERAEAWVPRDREGSPAGSEAIPPGQEPSDSPEGDTVAVRLSEDGREIVVAFLGQESRASLDRLIQLAASPRAQVSDGRSEAFAETLEAPVEALALDLPDLLGGARLLLRRLRVERLDDGPAATEFSVEALLLRTSSEDAPG